MTGREEQRGFGPIRKLPSGRWQASYAAPDLRRLNAPLTFVTKADAEAGSAGSTRRSRTAPGTAASRPNHRRAPRPSATTATTWVATRDIKPKTREGYEHLLTAYLAPGFGERPWPRSPPAGADLVVALDPDTPTVRARAYTLLKAIMNTAVADDVIAANPCRIRGGLELRPRSGRPAGDGRGADGIVEAMPEQSPGAGAAGRLVRAAVRGDARAAPP